MIVARIAGATRNLGAPPEWEKDKHGTCGGLPIRDEMHAPGLPKMVSAWTPTPHELALLQAGAPVYLTVVGITHPPVYVGVGMPPQEDDEMDKTTLTNGAPVTPDHRDINPATGMQKAYVVLSEEERAKGFVRSVRRSYTHVKCGCLTTMGLALAETYARDPSFYSATFCVGCRDHFPVGEDGEFVWDGTEEKVGT